jgi:hypothetical protein
VLRLAFKRVDNTIPFNIMLNEENFTETIFSKEGFEEIDTFEFLLPISVLQKSGGKIEVKFTVHRGPVTGKLYDLRLLR